MQLLLRAIKYATRKHHGQVRRNPGKKVGPIEPGAEAVPYVSHTIAVSYIVAAYKRSKRLEELLAAAVLHDVLEDTDATEAELVKLFGLFVASLVLELTNDDESIRRIGKAAYQRTKMLGISNYGLVLKLADRMHNISDEPTQKMVKDTLELTAVLRKGRKLTKTQTRMVNDLEQLCHDRLAEFQARATVG